HETLELIGELMRLEAPAAPDPGGIAGERRIGKRRFERRVLQRVQLQLEKDQRPGDGIDAIENIGAEFPDRGIAHIGRKEQHRIAAGPPEDLGYAFVARNRLGQRARPLLQERRKLALIAGGKGLRLFLGLRQITLKTWILRALIEIAQSPAREL